MARFSAIQSGWVVGVLNASIPPSVGVPSGMVFIDTSSLPEVTIGWHYDVTLGMFSEATVTQKEQFLTALRDQMTVMGQTIEKMKSLADAYVQRGYDAAAADPITDADLAQFGVVVYDLGLAINLMQQIQTMMADPYNDRAVAKWRQL